jgi:hypothetical protein
MKQVEESLGASLVELVKSAKEVCNVVKEVLLDTASQEVDETASDTAH